MVVLSTILGRYASTASKRIRHEVLFEEHLDRYVDSVKGARIRYRYREAKSQPAKKVFALLAGWTCSPAAFIPIIPALNAENDIITMENRGHWRSALGTSSVDSYLSDLAHDLKAVMDEEGVKKAVLVAHSMWGISAVKFYHAFRDQVEAIVFICPALSSPLELWSFGNSVSVELAIKALLSFLEYNPITNFATHALAGNRIAIASIKRIASMADLAKNGHDDDLAFSRFMQQVLATDKKTRALALRAMLRESADGLMLDQVDVPVMLITGELDWLIVHDKVLPLARIMPHCEHVVRLPGVAHVPPLEAPIETASLIREFTRSALQ
ncbi:alpha/beta hydrolase [Candidatus Micrarchaeota archaeon]|nr:alpha/beta hydrolase [Candidatus Micrarchaeota archaeon]